MVNLCKDIYFMIFRLFPLKVENLVLFFLEIDFSDYCVHHYPHPCPENLEWKWGFLSMEMEIQDSKLDIAQVR